MTQPDSSHYKLGGIECIDAMAAVSTPEEFRGFLKLSAFKYLFRSNHKNSTDMDIKKAKYYIDRLVTEIEIESED